MKGKTTYFFSTRQFLLELGRWIIVALLAVLVLRGLLGNRISNAEFDSVQTAVFENVTFDNMQEADNQMIRRLYGLNPAECEGIVLYYPLTNMGAEEILLVKLSDPGQQSVVEQAMEARLSVQLKNFDGYGTYQTAMLESSRIIVQGNYALFVSADNADEIAEAFAQAL